MNARSHLLLAWLTMPALASAQAISPGKLSQAHAHLESVRECTSCHELRTPGASPARCLACHAPLRARAQQGKGFHGRQAGKYCGDCHKEHFGRDGALVRLDTAQFDHRETGYTLAGAHARARCRACHRAARVSAPDVRAAAGKSLSLERTFLGLPTSCAGCHASDDPHGGQFAGRDCDSCHGPGGWRPAAAFDHDAARFPLTGRHQEVECARCHETVTRSGAQLVRYTGLAFSSCRSCHSDPHRGAMGGECTQCHTTAGWGRVPAAAVATRFQHASTRFPLRGAHAQAPCASCHGRGERPGVRVRFVAGTEAHTYPRPVAGACSACHLDAHGGAFLRAPETGACDVCHAETGWSPASFDAARHGTTAFPLTGAHAAVPCGSCHPRAVPGAARFRIADRSCRACHAAQDPHRGAFGAAPCDRCHETATFHVATWDHARSAGIACRTCHADRDPHGTQFADRACSDCHTTASFRVTGFDHRRTRFPLEGRHAALECRTCHVPVRDPADGVVRTRYRPLPVTCAGCHGGGL